MGAPDAGDRSKSEARSGYAGKSIPSVRCRLEGAARLALTAPVITFLNAAWNCSISGRVRVDLFAFINQSSMFKAGRSRYQRGDRHKVTATVVVHFLEQIRTPESDTASYARHPVEFGKSAQDDHVFVRFHQIHGGSRI